MMKKIIFLVAILFLIFSGLFYFSNPIFAFCENQCYPSGSTRCNPAFPNTIQICQDFNNDGCLEWVYKEDCSSSIQSVCDFGDCLDSEKPYNIRCVGTGETASCDYDCNFDPFCCQNECYPLGRERCADNSNKQICGEYDNDYCLEWSDNVLCSGSTSCATLGCAINQRPSWYCQTIIQGLQGLCAYSCVNDLNCCTNECSSGQTGCFDTTHKKTCGNYDEDNCWDWPTELEDLQLCTGSTACDYGICDPDEKPVWRCDRGECIYDCFESSECGTGPCTNECSPLGKKECLDNTRKRTCGYYDSDSCLDWYIQSCIGDTSCDYRDCTANQKPSWYCNEGDCYYNCVYNSNCAISPCVSQCSSKNQSQCVGDYKKVCDDYNGDGCLEWSSLQSCTGDTSCDFENCLSNQRPSWYCDPSNGQCKYLCSNDSSCGQEPPPPPPPSCTNECPERWLTRCVNDTQKKVCGYNYIKDGCLHWYPPEDCSGDTSCDYEECNSNQKPVWKCQSNSCIYECVEDSNCVSGYIKEFKKDCYDNDVYWFDTENAVQDKVEECEDENPETIDGCQDRKCYHRSEEEQYCEGQDHCGDGICNCEEDIYVCFEDCELAELEITFFVKKESDKEDQWQEALNVSSGEKMDFLLIVSNKSRQEVDNVIIKVELPQEIVYKGELKIEQASSEDNILEGINIGLLSLNGQRRISFKGEVVSGAAVGSQVQIIGKAEMENLSDNDSVGITIEKSETGILKWLVSRWYLWLILWAGFVAFLYWVLKRSSA